MATYFCFSDECGNYIQNISEKQYKIHPHYVRSVLIIDSAEWKILDGNFKALKLKYGIPYEVELKWAFPWKIKSGCKIKQGDAIEYFRDQDPAILIQFIRESLLLINNLNHVKIILTITDNNKTDIAEKYIFKFHFQEILQRIEMEYQHSKDNLAVLFIDPVSPEKNKLFREIYFDLTHHCDFIKNYNHLKDSLNIEYSHHSVGIQLADYISGVFNSVLRCDSPDKYQDSISMFFESIYPNLRKGRNSIAGYGIREIPINSGLRQTIMSKIQSLKPDK